MVVAAQAIRGYPCVSLMANTHPGQTMASQDEQRLRKMAGQALERLEAAGHAGRGSAMERELHLMIDAAATSPTGAAVAVLASRAMSRAIRLAVPVAERVVVDHTFATRDLVRSLHRTPRHLVLVLEPHRARLLDGSAGELRPAATHAFPVRTRTDLTRRVHEEDRRAFFDSVDRRLGLFRSLHPSPLVVMGPPSIVADYLRMARHANRLAGVLRHEDVPTSVEGLQARIKPVMADYLRSRQDEALELLRSRQASGAVAAGLAAAWTAARRSRPEMLAVEPGLMSAARLGPGGDTLILGGQIGDPDVVDDIVDELIELVLAGADGSHSSTTVPSLSTTA